MSISSSKIEASPEKDKDVPLERRLAFFDERALERGRVAGWYY
jgi:hypothetical protein